MAGEQIPVKHNVTGDETTMPAEALEVWKLKGWEPTEADWRTRYNVDAPSDSLTVLTNAEGEAVVDAKDAVQPPPPG